MFCWTKNTPKPEFFWKTERIIQNAKTQKRLEICQNLRYALWPEVSNPLGSVVSGGPRIHKTRFFGKTERNHSKRKNSKTSRDTRDTHFDQRDLIHREAWFPPCFVRQNKQKSNFFFAAILDNFQTKMLKSEITSCHYFAPRIPNLWKYWTSDFG